MTRVRSPNYPAIGLPEAIDRLKQFFGKAQRRLVSREQAAEAMGYDGLHGGSLGTLSALLKFGLLVKQNGQVLVSERGMAIVAPQDEKERRVAIESAAFAFPLFEEVRERFLGDIPSDDKLRSFLLRKNFSSSALEKVCRSYRETMELVLEVPGGYDTARPQESAETDMAHEIGTAESAHPARTPPSGTLGVPFRVSLEGDAIEVSGRLTTPEEVEKLVKILELSKVIITPVSGAFDTEYTADKEGRKAKERDLKLDE